MTKTPPKTVLAIDPGITIGWCLFIDGEVNSLGTIKLDSFTNWLESFDPKPDVIVVEDYKLFKHKALQQSGSRMETVKVIGMIESYVVRNRIKIVRQPSNILTIAGLWTETPIPKKSHLQDQVSAYLHGSYWLIRAGYKEVEM